MPPKAKVYVVVGCLAFAAALSIASGATKPGVADAAYEGFSVTPPTANRRFRLSRLRLQISR
jgi:hypothetical protein